MNLKKVFCGKCGKAIYRSRGRINENIKFGHNFYCSLKCQSKFKTKKQKLLCEKCGKSFWRQLNDISPHNYCSQSCAAIVNNKRYPKWHPVPILKICEQCGQKYKKSTNNKKYCSRKCRGEAKRRTPEDLIKIIKETIEKLNRIPSRREIRRIADSCKKAFGSWNNAIIAAGFQPNRSHSQRMYKRTKAKALDGHLCDSISELLIDNWLTKNKINHERNIPYPGTKHRADWGINIKGEIIFIEYFGLAHDSPRYDRSIRKKKKMCQKNNIALIPIYPKDLYPGEFLEENLKSKFEKFSTA